MVGLFDCAAILQTLYLDLFVRRESQSRHHPHLHRHLQYPHWRPQRHSDVDPAHEIDCCGGDIKWVEHQDTRNHGYQNLYFQGSFLLGITELIEIVYRLIPFPFLRGIQLS